MLNIVALMGRLTADPELKKTSGDVSVATVRIAVDRSYVRHGEERQADFISIVCWRQTADFVCKYFHKGDMIAVNGRIQTRQYEDKDGAKRTAVEVVAEAVHFCGSKGDGNKTDARAEEPANLGKNDADFEILGDGEMPF